MTLRDKSSRVTDTVTNRNMDDRDFLLLDPLLAEATVLEVTTLGRTKFRELLRAGEFPAPRQISTCRVAWKSSDVQTWIDQRPIADAYQEDQPEHFG